MSKISSVRQKYSLGLNCCGFVETKGDRTHLHKLRKRCRRVIFNLLHKVTTDNGWWHKIKVFFFSKLQKMTKHFGKLSNCSTIGYSLLEFHEFSRLSAKQLRITSCNWIIIVIYYNDTGYVIYDSKLWRALK